jgi:hypothetical protein
MASASWRSGPRPGWRWPPGRARRPRRRDGGPRRGRRRSRRGAGPDPGARSPARAPRRAGRRPTRSLRRPPPARRRSGTRRDVRASAPRSGSPARSGPRATRARSGRPARRASRRRALAVVQRPLALPGGPGLTSIQARRSAPTSPLRILRAGLRRALCSGQGRLAKGLRDHACDDRAVRGNA